jgi:hypothetical protein
VILMREGAVAYHGPREALPSYVSRLGFHPPAALPPLPLARGTSDGSSSAAAHEDIADWLTELMTHPHKVYRRG